MPMLIADPLLAERLKAERELMGGDRFDEVWQGTYVRNPLPNVQHQDLVACLVAAFMDVLHWSSVDKVFGGVNVSDRDDGWEHNYRAPDVAIYLASTSAVNCGAHWRGGPDLAIEIVSPGDRTRDKIPFYEQVGTRELFILDRVPWALEHLALESGRLISLGQSTCEAPLPLASRVLPVTLRLLAGTPRPRIEIVRSDDARTWLA